MSFVSYRRSSALYEVKSGSVHAIIFQVQINGLKGLAAKKRKVTLNPTFAIVSGNSLRSLTCLYKATVLFQYGCNKQRRANGPTVRPVRRIVSRRPPWRAK